MWGSAIGCIVTLTLSLLAVPLAARAQQPTKVPRVGYLSDESSSLGFASLRAHRTGAARTGIPRGAHDRVVYLQHAANSRRLKTG
jgi:hypothetical protein